MRPVRVLVVDDSGTMRALIRRTLMSDPGIQVIGEAESCEQARSAIKSLDPDVLTLDIELPGMNGLDFLEKIMRLRPMPVVMVSSLTTRGADATIRALELGAVDYVAKPSPADPSSLDRLPQIIRGAATARRSLPGAEPAAQANVAPVAAPRASRVRLVALAASTGGVEALLRVFAGLPPNCPPVAVVQHMPPLFTTSFAKRLDRHSAVRVTEATDGSVLESGMAVIAPGGERHLEIVGSLGGPLRCRLVEADPESGHRPSADRLFRSAARTVGARAVGAILTGMGGDGAQGLLEMRQAGAHTIGQDASSSIVYGMPAVAFRLGAVAEQLPLDQIAAGIVRALSSPQDKRINDHAVRQSS